MKNLKGFHFVFWITASLSTLPKEIDGTQLAAATITKVVGTKTTIDVTWTAAVGPKDKYKVSCGTHHFIADKADTNTLCTGLTPGTEYVVTVRTIKAGWVDAVSRPMTAKTKLAPVRALYCEGRDTELKMQWVQAFGDKNNYIVSCGEFHFIADKFAEQMDCTGLASGTPYNVTVRTVKAGWEDAVSNTILIYTSGTPKMTPATITTVVRSDTALEISWTAGIGPKDKYKVSCGTYFVFTDGFATKARFDDLIPGTEYAVAIKTFSRWNYIVSKTKTAKTKLAAATITNVIVHDERTFDVYWTSARGNKEGYRISCDSTNYVLKSQMGFLFGRCNNLNPGTEYSVTVMTLKSGWDEVASSPKTAKTKLATTTITNAVATNTTIDVSWTATMNVAKLRLTCTSQGLVKSLDFNGRKCSGLTPGTEYYVTVTSIKPGWADAVSTGKSAKTKLTPATITTIVEHETTIDVGWTAASGNVEEYRLSCNGNSFLYVSQPAFINGKCGGLSPGTQYSVTVTTLKSGWDEVVSASKTAKTKLAAATIVRLIGSETTVDVSWTPAKGNKDSYKVFCGSNQFIVDKSATNSLCTGLTSGTEYTVTITTVKAGWADVISVPKKVKTS